MMRFAVFSYLFMALAACPCVVSTAYADEPAPENDARAAEALMLTRQVARALHLYESEDRASGLTLVETPLQRYTNPIAGEFYAHLFIWTKAGRPEAAAAIAKWYVPRNSLHLEFHSLALRPLTAEYKDAPIWHPTAAGVTFEVIPGSPAPARSAVARLREMRQLARDFRARVKALNRGGVDEDLRLLAKPVYRYQNDAATVLDGAIFSFVRGTDPELLLLIEARQAGDAFAWEYALAPMNSFEFYVYHGDREVWHKPQIAPPWQNTRDPNKPYMVYLAPINQ